MDLLTLYNSLTVETLAELVRNRQEEHLSLDFKTVGSPELNGNDKKNLAEVLSGFSNSAGGVVIWGIATERNSAGQDVAAELKPISNVVRFASRLDEFTPLLITPMNKGIGHRAIENAEGTGFAVSFVPESDAGPHMALGGHHRYFKRAGDRFYRMEHFDVADMFGRRQRAALRVQYHLGAGGTLMGPPGTRRELLITVRLRNEGRASAIAPYIRLRATPPLKIRAAGISSERGDSPLHMFSEESGHAASFIGGTEVILHPKAAVRVAQLSAEFWDHERVPPELSLAFQFAAMDIPLVEEMVDITPESIAKATKRPEAS